MKISNDGGSFTMGQLKKKVLMAKRWLRMLSGQSVTAIAQKEGKCYSIEKIEGYYNDLTGKVSSGTLLDDEGIPITQVSNNEFVHFPIAIFQYGLGCYDLFLKTQEDVYIKKFQLIANWAVSNIREDGSWDSFSPIKSKLYTVSSMCQGEGASLLFRAYKVFDDEKYKTIGFKAVDFMLKDINDGGVAVYKENELYLEEYPQTPRLSVLNGWIFSIFGLFDAVKLDEKYKEHFIKTVNSLISTLEEYNTGYWSYYDLSKRIASPAYHDLHIALLNVMYDITGRIEFKNYSEKFKNYQNKKSKKIKAILKKAYQKITEKTDAIVVQ